MATPVRNGRRRRSRSRLLLAITSFAVVIGLVIAGVVLWSGYTKTPLPSQDHCTAVAGGNATSIDPEQALNAAIIAGVGLGRGLPPRAVSIALATAYQESGIRNLDYGHADSIGLFQQRPSQGWGTPRQIMDPYYSSGKFYSALVRVKDWRTSDINDVAQLVQRSGHPEAYRKHVQNARTLASSLTGETPASLTCVVARPAPSDAEGLASLLRKALGQKVEVSVTPTGLTIRADSSTLAWATAHIAIASLGRHGTASVSVGDRTWQLDPKGQEQWTGASDQGSRTVTVGFTG